MLKKITEFKNIAAIYSIVNPFGHVYIGQTRQLHLRLIKHKNTLNESKISKSIQEYGFENHRISVLHQLPNDVDSGTLSSYEFLYYTQYKECGFELLNIQEANGKNGRMAESTKKKMREAHKGTVISEAHKMRLSELKKGKPLHENTRRGHAEHIKSYVATKETNNKISETMKRIWAERKAAKP